MLDMSYNTTCVECGDSVTLWRETIHFPGFTHRNDDSPVRCYYCPCCGLQVRIADNIDGTVLERIRDVPQYADRIETPYFSVVADLLYTFYDPDRKYTLFAIPELDLHCPAHQTPMRLSVNWLAQPPLDCQHCGAQKSVVPYNDPPDLASLTA